MIEESHDTTTVSKSEQAFRDLLGTLGEAAEMITGPRGARDARERAEGLRHLTRLLSVWLETTGIRSFNITIRALKGEEETLEMNFRREKLPAATAEPAVGN